MVESLNLTKKLNIKSISGENLAEIDVIMSNRQLIDLLNGRPKNITETRVKELMINSGVILTSSRRLIFSGPVIALGLTGKSLFIVK